MGSHHIYGPSSLRRRQLCQGSAKAETGMPDEESGDAAMGTRLHACAGSGVWDGADDAEQELLAWCERTVSELQDKSDCMLIETKMMLADTNGQTVMFGTPDFATPYDVVEYKFGYLPVAPAAENIQLAAQAAMAMQYYEVDEITAHVLQPRLNVHDSYTYTNLPGIVATIKGIIAACEQPAAPLIPGEEQCRYCKGKLRCPAAKACLSTVADLGNPDVTDKQAAAIWELGQVAKKVDKAVVSLVKARCAENETCGHLTTTPTRGARVVEDSAEVLYCLLESHTMTEFAGACTISPNVLERLGMVPLVEDLITRRPDTVSIVRADK